MQKQSIFIILLIFSMSLSSAQTFEDFLNRVNESPVDQKTAIVDSFMTAVPSFPFIENDTLTHFIYRNTANSVSIAGDATGWDPQLVMEQLEDTNFWYHTTVYEADARLDYKYVINGINWILDPRNPHQVPSGFGSNSELRLPAWEYPLEINDYPEIPHGTIEDTLFYSQFLGNTRQIKIYLPPAYFVTEIDYPAILFHDGLEYISLAQTDNVFDYLIHNHQMQPCVGIFVPPIDRTREYAGDLQDEFTQFITDELLPWMDSRYRVLEDPSAHLTLGASNGGNIALWLAVSHPEIFGYVAAQSSNVQSSISNALQNGPLLDLDFYLDIGSYDIGILIPLVQNLEQVLADRGYPYEYYWFHEGHSWGNWRSHMDLAFMRFAPFDPDFCTNLYGESSILDDCGVCSGGASGHEPNSDIDECGVCFGENSCQGCTDPYALNYNPWATMDDGSCLYPQTVDIYFGTVDEINGTLPIMLNNPGPAACWGFQFIVSGVNLSGASGGSSQEYGIFPVATGQNGSVLGFNLNQSSIPPGDEVLTILTFEGTTADSTCISNAVISGGAQIGELAVNYGPCFRFGIDVSGCMDPAAVNYNPEATINDGSCSYGIPGDLNMTNDFDILDIIYMVDIILGSLIPTPLQFWAADLNEDQYVDVSDVLLGVNILLGFEE